MKNLKVGILVLLVSVTLVSKKSISQTVIHTDNSAQEFCLNADKGLAAIWGKEKSIPGIYFEETLPAFFERKLVLSKADLKTSKMKWVFTGQQGGITITLSSDSVKLEQRYYNSFGFNEVKDGNVVAARHPQKEFTNYKASLKDKAIKSVTLEVNHGLGLKLFINDLLITEQTTQLDISQHQIQIEGLKIDVCGKLQIPPATVSKININNSKKYQQILGFGGITSLVAYNILSKEGKEKWWNFLKDYNLLIQREYPIGSRLKADYSNWDNLDDATPHYYGDNFPNGEISDFGYNKKIQEMGGAVVFEFWTFPGWMYDESVSKDGKAIRTINYNKYAEAMVNYCKTAKLKTGKAPSILGIQNEVKQQAEVWEQLTLHLRKALDENGFKEVKIHMHNSNNLANGVEALDVFTSKKSVWDNIDFTASNLYDYQNNFNNPDGFDKMINNWNSIFKKNNQQVKPFLSVEMCINNNKYQSGSYKVAFTMAELYHKNMVDMNAVSLMYCWLLLNNTQPSFSESRSLFTLDEKHNNLPIPSSFQLRTFGSFSRHLAKGMERIDAFTADKDLLVSAYAKDNQETIIILNRGTSNKKINIEGYKKITMMEITSPYQENKVEKIKDLNDLIIAPGSIVTLF